MHFRKSRAGIELLSLLGQGLEGEHTWWNSNCSNKAARESLSMLLGNYVLKLGLSVCKKKTYLLLKINVNLNIKFNLIFKINLKSIYYNINII